MPYQIKGEAEIAKGLGLPRLTTAERTAYTAPAAGYVVFDTDLGGIFYWDGAAWQAFPTLIDGLADVDTSTTAPVPNDFLAWNDTNSQWEPAAVPVAVVYREFLNVTGTPGGGSFTVSAAEAGNYLVRAQYQVDRASAGGGTTAWTLSGSILDDLEFSQTGGFDAGINDFETQTFLLNIPAGTYTLTGSTSGASGNLSFIGATQIISGFRVGTVTTPVALNDLSDVDTVTNPPVDGDVLQWNNAFSRWEPTAPDRFASAKISVDNDTQNYNTAGVGQRNLQTTVFNEFVAAVTVNATGYFDIVEDGTYEVTLDAFVDSSGGRAEADFLINDGTTDYPIAKTYIRNGGASDQDIVSGTIKLQLTGGDIMRLRSRRSNITGVTNAINPVSTGSVSLTITKIK